MSTDLVFSIEPLSVEALVVGAEFEHCGQSLSLFQTNYEAASCNATYNTSSHALLTPAIVARDILSHICPRSLTFKDLELARITTTPTRGALVVTASDGGRFHLLRHDAPVVDWRTLHASIARYHVRSLKRTHRSIRRTLERLEQDFAHVPRTYVTLVLSLCGTCCPSRRRRREEEENDLPSPSPKRIRREEVYPSPTKHLLDVSNCNSPAPLAVAPSDKPASSSAATPLSSTAASAPTTCVESLEERVYRIAFEEPRTRADFLTNMRRIYLLVGLPADRLIGTQDDIDEGRGLYAEYLAGD